MPDYQRLLTCLICGWGIGEIYRNHNQRGTQLRVYRHARNPDAGLFTDPAPEWFKYAAIAINDGTILCEHCGAKTVWYASEYVLKELLGKVRRNKVEA